MTAAKQTQRRVLEAEFEAVTPALAGCRWLAITSGKKRFVFTLVDEDMFDVAAQTLWALSNRGYAASNRVGQQSTTYLHHVVFDVDQEIDHVNRNKLDNRRVNLRLATRGQNTQNIVRCNQTGYVGVTPNSGKFIARVSVNGERLYLGRFSSAEDAAKAYDEAAARLCGGFALLNFPTENNPCSN